MKKISLFAFALVATMNVMAQNIQFHHDFGRDLYSDEEGERPRNTLTYEMFKADKYGSTYMFVDLDFYRKGMAGAYTELARELSLYKNNTIAAHLEYDGGLTSGKGPGAWNAHFQHALLFGPAYNGHSADFSKTWSVQAMYKQYFAGDSREGYASWQLTGVWSTTFAHKFLTFSGFADLWYDNATRGNLIFLTEPQIWFNFNAIEKLKDFNLSIGGEVEISNNFITATSADGCTGKNTFINPTLALKWTF